MPITQQTQAGDHFAYDIPDAVSSYYPDLANGDFKLEVIIDSFASDFIKYDESRRKITIAEGAATNINAGIYDVKFKLTDPYGNTSTTVTKVEILAKANEPVVEEAAEVAEVVPFIDPVTPAEVYAVEDAQQLEKAEDLFEAFPGTDDWNFLDVL